MKRVKEASLFEFVDLLNCKIILDIGATKGDFVGLTSHLDVEKCISIEADPAHHKELKNYLDNLNIGKNHKPYIPVLKALTSNSSGDQIACMFDKHWGKGCCYTVEQNIVDERKDGYSFTETISLPDIFREYELEKVDFMKIDIEGSEFAIFKDKICFDLITKNVQSMTIEFHLHYLRDVLGYSAQQASETFFDIVQKLESSNLEVIVSAGRDFRGKVLPNFEIDGNTYCIDLWAFRRETNEF